MKIKQSALILLSSLALAGCQTTVQQSAEEDQAVDQADQAAIQEGHRQLELDDDQQIEEEPYYNQTITIGYNGGLCQLAAPLAAARGQFEEAGLDVQIVNAPNQIDAVGTNQVQVTTKHIAETLVPTVSGLDIYFTQSSQSGCTNLYVPADSPIQSTEDLVGKKVGITNGYGGSRHNIALRFFGNDGIQPEEVDYTVVEESSSVLALEKDEVDALVLQDTFAKPFEKQGRLKAIRSQLDDDFAHEPCCVHYMNGSFVDENPLIAKKIDQIIEESSQWIEQNYEEAVAISFEQNWLTGEKEDALELIQSYDWTIDDEQTQQTLLQVGQDYQDFGIFPQEINVEDEIAKLWLPL